MTAPARHHTRRNASRATNGPGVGLIAAAKGRPQMPWQRDAAAVALELDAAGHYVYGIVVVTVPRQSGKTALEGDVADHRCLTRRRARCWVTMQNGKTVDSWMREEHFADLEAAGVFEGRYTLSRRAGEVGVKWPAPIGSTFLTFPPKRDALHSKQGDLVIVDEAWVHDAEAGQDLRQAIRPTMATRAGAQLWIVSTEGDDRSHYLDHYIEMGRAALGDPDARVCFVDYGIPDEADPEDLEVIAAHHPAYGYTIGMPTLVDARADFGADVAGWARAYGNRRTRTRVAAIAPEVWAAAARSRLEVPRRAGIALDVTPGGDLAAIAASWRDDAGHRFVEVLTAGRSDRSTVDLLVQLGRTRRVPIVADRGSYGAVEVLDAVGRAAPDVDLRYLSLGEFAASCATFERGVRDDTLHHFNQPDLDAAVANATKRPLGDGGFGWGRKDSAGNIAPLVAGTVALRACDTLPPETSRPRVVTSRP